MELQIVATAMVVCAHFLGKKLHEEVARRPLAIVLRVLLVAVPLAAIVYVAMLRRDFVQQQALSAQGSAQQLGVNVTISILVFFSLALYSYEIHDPVVHAVLKAWKERRTKERLVHLAEKATASARIDREQKHRKMLRDASGILVVFSDMVEDSARANFEQEQLSAVRIKSLIATEEKNNRLPDLKGVDLWVAGATPDRRMDEQRIRTIETFWESYFVRCGTVLMPERYGPALLNFDPDRNQGGTPQ